MTGRKYTHRIDAFRRRYAKRVVDLVVATSPYLELNFTWTVH